MNLQQAIDYLKQEYVIEPTIADPRAHLALIAVRETVDTLLEAVGVLFTVIANVDTVYEGETGHTIEQDFAEELDRVREIVADARGGEITGD